MMSTIMRRAYYQMSTDSGYVIVEMPFRMSPDDANDTVENLELIIRHIRRRTSEAVDGELKAEVCDA